MCFRVCRWLADIPKSEYWTGSRYPAKSTIFPPLATWKSWRGVWRELLRRIMELTQLTSEERRRPNLRANNIPPACSTLTCSHSSTGCCPRLTIPQEDQAQQVQLSDD